MSNNLITINNQFNFNFPIDFVSNKMEAKFMPYLKSKRKLHSTVLDYLNSTIVDISFPALNFNTVSNPQNLHRKHVTWKAVDNIFDLFDKTITVTVNDVDSHINYFIFLNILSEKYLNSEKAYDENIQVIIVDENRNALYEIHFRSVIWTGLSDINLAYNQQTMGQQQFTLTFTYNYIDIVWINNQTDNVKDNLY